MVLVVARVNSPDAVHVGDLINVVGDLQFGDRTVWKSGSLSFGAPFETTIAEWPGWPPDP